ncbi:hypothetical protein TSUD_162460 [Trifolium subterraneum]|uniref:Endonuclease/exonuclease/phosphatase domain-containing protein n=1 Tax=Trifolium subterraneum TaxID=3900 RepID=A0A2Z6MSN7_TRISU|nr:hypothetical protein TSUD_162460 [Trifolium subterraneum]
MQGNDQMTVDDVRGMGKAIGVQGLGGAEKRKEVRKLVGEKHPLIVCLQETKVQSCDDTLVSALWGSAPHAFSFLPSVGVSGGLLTIWNSSEVEVWSSVSREHVLVCHGRFISSGEAFFVVNVYAPCDSSAKQRLWDSLSARLQSLVGMQVAQLRGLSDHCPSVWVSSEENWEPRPLRMLKCGKTFQVTTFLLEKSGTRCR